LLQSGPGDFQVRMHNIFRVRKHNIFRVRKHDIDNALSSL
jgi:hypothetical protein